MMGRVSRCRVAASCLLVPLVLDLTGCSSWQQTHARSEPVAPQIHPKKVRAHLVDGRVVVLNDPWFASDTLYGLAEGPAKPSNAKPEIYGRSQASRDSSTQHVVGASTAIPIAQIASLEAWQHSSGRTVAFVLGMTVGIVYLLAAMAGAL